MSLGVSLCVLRIELSDVCAVEADKGKGKVVMWFILCALMSISFAFIT
jgi:hypothetical protein